ncbi:MAG: M23 family metallopeptidase [Lachnospiraceae bacterium]
MKKKNLMRAVFVTVLLLTVIRLEHDILYKYAQRKEPSADETDDFFRGLEMFDVICSEIQCFPVVPEEDPGSYPVAYEDSWGEARSYGGERVHEGCDLMAAENTPGLYAVCSMTDGVVEKIGWLEQGGWRIGIRSSGGVYYYYAHLDSYEKAFEEGEEIRAGQVLGQMGDSGYGKEPGTRGNFPVHLHVGIYVTDKEGTERAVNPYWYLRMIEK